MKHRRSSLVHILIFILAQTAWLSLLGIWIYWYVTNYIIFSSVDDHLSAQIVSEGRNVFVLVSGLILLIIVSVLMSLQFHRLNIQFNLAGLYDNFISNVTHELKSPLASIQLALETMHRYNLPESRQKEFIRMMLKDTERLNKLINAILEIPALEQKRIAHNFQVYPIGRLMHEIIGESREQFNVPDSAIHVEGDASCECVADRNALKIVIDNLMDNSIKYSSEAVQITVTMHCAHKCFVLDFQDKGIGISAQHQKKIFDKFYRIHDRSSPSVKGTGLGLYWSREIIKYHGGRISIHNRGRHHGTLFRIELPIYRAVKNRYIQNLLKVAQKRRLKETADDRL
ncbi:HAMP domain-containing histidine kinase [bacterium]|nr:HAMP domain-containing histidine kinase [bacterium]